LVAEICEKPTFPIETAAVFPPYCSFSEICLMFVGFPKKIDRQQLKT